MFVASASPYLPVPVMQPTHFYDLDREANVSGGVAEFPAKDDRYTSSAAAMGWILVVYVAAVCFCHCDLRGLFVARTAVGLWCAGASDGQANVHLRVSSCCPAAGTRFWLVGLCWSTQSCQLKSTRGGRTGWRAS